MSGPTSKAAALDLIASIFVRAERRMAAEVKEAVKAASHNVVAEPEINEVGHKLHVVQQDRRVA